MLDPALVEILACPACGAPLRYEDDRLVCTAVQVAFPVEDGVPVLLVDRAVPPHPAAPHDVGEPSE